MFDDLIRELKRIESEPVRLPIDTDADGYFDRECPDDECQFQFKVIVSEWENSFEGKKMYCPLCGTLAPADHFWTQEHLEQARQQALRHFSGRIGQAMARDARSFNAKQPRGGFISISLEYKGPTHLPALVPVEAAEEMQLKIACEQCGAHFAVIGSAFFCPKCGQSSAVRMFNDALAKIEAKIEHLDRAVQAVAQIDKDAAELTRRSMLESGVSDAVVAFQRLMEERYRAQPNASQKLPKNVFQRLIDGSSLWKAAGYPSYSDVLSPMELAGLNIFFHRRHLLAHKEGIVDDQYIQRSNDTKYTVGQRVVVRPEHVIELVRLVRKLVTPYLSNESKA
ncbi:MAG: hypothetical protein RBR35_15855 [Salinivirgaceae bacterium]|nr:hypothetical protein [Salinivirgaceae bacterium]